ncbi:MAG: hypothetical protein BGP06_08510 [Rhizobiales bacterium 65-9]|nr:MAG: hypothetical protein BGP06_08510 [Rhizobiales bacterium 65-9]
MRRARMEDAERVEVAAELRSGEIGRLERLRVALAPVFAQTGRHADAFDHGLAAGERPKLFIDMIAFIDCGHDRKSYRFVQDTRDGQRMLAQSEAVEPIVEAVTMYVARRIVEREKAMAADGGPPRERVAAAPSPPGPGRFGEMLLIYLAGAASGAAALYALLNVGLAH